MENNRVEGQKNSLDAYPVQSLEVATRDVYEINYSGTPMLITKEVYTELVNKAMKNDELVETNRALAEKHKELIKRYKKVRNDFQTLEKDSKELEQLADKLQAENERLKRALLLEQQSHSKTALELSKFKQAPPTKKAYLSDGERTAIANFMIQHYKAKEQFPKVKDIHEWIMREGRARADRRLANISYETVRATVKDIRAERGW